MSGSTWADVVRAAAGLDGSAAGEGDQGFTTDHYRGHRSVLVRLPEIDPDRLADLIADAHATIAAMPAKRPRRRS